MEEIKKIISQTIEEKPKHFSQILKKNEKVVNAVNDWCSNLNTSSFAEKLYCFLHEIRTNVCKRGNKLKFKNIKDGYGFCGRSSVCVCNREIVSSKCKVYQSSLSDTEKKKIQQKREKTSLKRYGVKNNAQTEVAKSAHKDFYSNPEKVNATVRKAKKTKLDLYGDENYNNPTKIKTTCLEKYNVKCALLTTKDNSNPNLKYLRNKDELFKLYENYNVIEISKILGVHPQTVYKYLYDHGLREKYKSTEEKDLLAFLKKDLGIKNIICNSRKILPSGKELDIYLPDFNIAIEYNGVYWHNINVPHITKNYHYDKFKECESIGIQLITIFSVFWKSKTDIVKRMLAHKLNVSSQKKIYARNCNCRKLKILETKQFLIDYHIQGYSTAQYAYGLFHGDELVAVMTFSNNRTGIGNNVSDEFELVRYCSSYTVVGGASKLLSIFVKDFSPTIIVSYSDNEWSTGELYKKLGFELRKEWPASYRYVLPKEEKFYHRYTFARHKLIEKGLSPELTTKEMIDKLGLLTVYDCGKRTWVKKI